MERVFSIPIFQVMNITDIDDKIVNRAKELGKDSTALARHYEEQFMSDLRSLSVPSGLSLVRCVSL